MKVSLCFLLFVAVLWIEGSSSEIPLLAHPPLRICAFNIQVFGAEKMKKVDAVENIIQILLRYDLILIQEIRDSSETAFPQLVVLLNERIAAANGNLGETFSTIISTRLGRSNSKEQYGFLYRENLLSVIDSYQYPDVEDYFERPPFTVLFASPETELELFAVLALHSKPSAAPEELDNITRVYSKIQEQWSIENVLVAGDLNSDCTYLSDSDHNHVSLYNDPRFKWLIGDDVDTTTTHSECSYDRFIAAGGLLQQAYVPNSAKVFKFDEYFGLSTEAATDVSDHYPIEMQIKGKPSLDVQAKIDSYSKSVKCEGAVPVASKTLIRELYNKEDIWNFDQSYDVSVLNSGSRQYLVSAVLEKIPTVKDVKAEITFLGDEFEQLLTPAMEAMVIAQIDADFFNDNYVYGVQKTKLPYYRLELCCILDTLKCTVLVEEKFY